jgi:hypothetical protein
MRSQSTAQISEPEFPDFARIFCNHSSDIYATSSNIARVNVLRLAELLKDHKNMSIADVIALSNGLRSYLECIRSLSREQKVIYQNMTTIEQALEELKDIPPEVD